jgi:hypothetical protein
MFYTGYLRIIKMMTIFYIWWTISEITSDMYRSTLISHEFFVHAMCPWTSNEHHFDPPFFHLLVALTLAGAAFCHKVVISASDCLLWSRFLHRLCLELPLNCHRIWFVNSCWYLSVTFTHSQFTVFLPNYMFQSNVAVIRFEYMFEVIALG